MEHTDKIDRTIKIAMILLLLFAVYKQIEIVKTIQDNAEMLDADPFAYGAKRYGLDYTTCIISNTKTLWFNETNSGFIIRNEPFGSKEEIEWGSLK